MLPDVDRLRRMINAPSGCCGLDDDILYDLLERCQCYELAAYHACLMMAREDSLNLSDGVRIPSQREYWLTRALQFRPVRSGAVLRADEVSQ